jgi:hypothetical protein
MPAALKVSLRLLRCQEFSVEYGEMPEPLVYPEKKVIPESGVRSVVERWYEIHESLAQFWLANSAMAQQGGIEVHKLLSPDNKIWSQQYELSQYS